MSRKPWEPADTSWFERLVVRIVEDVSDVVALAIIFFVTGLWLSDTRGVTPLDVPDAVVLACVVHATFAICLRRER